MNSVNIIGRLGRDPEIRQTNAGKSVASFSLAVDRPTKREDGSRDVDWLDVIAWEQQADYISRYGGKGRLVAVSGRIQVRKYQGQDGQERRAIEVIAQNVSLLDRKDDPVAPQQQTRQAPPAPQRPAQPQRSQQNHDEDIPF